MKISNIEIISKWVYNYKDDTWKKNNKGKKHVFKRCLECNEYFFGLTYHKFCSKGHGSSYSNRGRKLSEETKKKISISRIGKIPSNKYNIEYIRKKFEEEGYKLLSKEYKNNRSKLKIQCPSNHLWEACYFNFQQGNRCIKCSGKEKHSYDYIKKQIEKANYKLLNKSYKKAFSKLKIQCHNNHIFSMKWNNFQQGQRCPICNFHNHSSKAENEIFDIISSKINHKIIKNDRTQITNPKTGWKLELDIWIPELNKAVEFNGTYWHSLKSCEYRDNQKLLQCKEKGIDLLVILEKDWQYNKNNCVNQIKSWINE